MKKTLLGAFTLTLVALLTSQLAEAQTYYYRVRSSVTSGNWNATGTWERSLNANFSGATNVTTTATLPSSTTALKVFIQSGKTVSVTANVTIGETEISSGGTLRWTGGTLSVASNKTLTIAGTYQDERNLDALPTMNSGASFNVLNGGIVKVLINTAAKDGYASDEYSFKNSIVWNNGAIFDWAISNAFTTTGLTYFPNVDASTIPVFRYSAASDVTVGANNPTTINGVFEVFLNGERVIWTGTGVKTFRNGIIGKGSIRQANGAGKFSFTGTTASLTIDDLELESNAGLVIENGCYTTATSAPSDYNIDYDAANGGEIQIASGAVLDIAANWAEINGNIEVLDGGTLDCRSSVLNSDNGDPSGTIIVQPWGNYMTAHTSGINGNKGLYINYDLKNKSSYIFDGTANQVTGSLMPSSVGHITVINTGSTNNKVTVSNATLLSVFGNVNIEDGMLELNNTVGADMHLYGSFNRHYANGSFDDKGRSISLKGNQDAQINFTSLPPASASEITTLQTFSQLVMDKDNASNKVTLIGSIAISDTLQMNMGILVAEAIDRTIIVVNESPDAVVGGSANSFVDGRLGRFTQPNTAATYFFPVGKSAISAYKPLEFTTVDQLSQHSAYIAEYFGGSGITNSNFTEDLFSGTLMGILKNEYWQFDRVHGVGTGILELNYNYPGANGYWRSVDHLDVNPDEVNGELSVAVVKRSATSGNGAWGFTKEPRNFNTNGNKPEARGQKQNGKIVTGEIKSFSPFTIGFDYSFILGSPRTLPVKLISFTGSAKGNQGMLNWSIDSDKDLSGFVLEQSSNGQQYLPAKTIGPKGTNYSNQAVQLKPGTNYFRLKVQEKTGYSYYSQVLILNASEAATVIVGMQQTVVQQTATALIQSAGTQTAEVMLIDLSGKQLLSKSVALQMGGNQVQLPAGNLQKGLYFLLVRTQDGVQRSLRFVKE